MDRFRIAINLMRCFPNSFINHNGEFIAHRQANEYFRLDNCCDEIDVKCKVLEWFSRGAHKTERFNSKRKNDEYHGFMLNGINQYLNTNFSEADIALVYDRLGNCINHKLTVKFVESGYDMELLRYGAKWLDVH